MSRRFAQSFSAAALIAALVVLAPTLARAVETTPVSPDALAKRMEAMTKDVTQGALRVVKEDGEVVECPLRHTDVAAEVSGFIARVKVTQTFYNPLAEKIEAVYVFPLPHKAAVDDMTMVIGERRIVGVIKRRAAAREIYEQALAMGAAAALLEQERPNIFTQSVGNIEPHQVVKIEISYVDALEYDMGVYEFHFPMVVGPRYIPGGPTSKTPPVPPELKGKVGELPEKVTEGAEPKGTGWSPDTTRVPDASRITPPVLKPGLRNGHDISLAVHLEAGVPIQDLKVTSHEAAIARQGPSGAEVKLSAADAIPNKAFVLRYGVVGQLPAMAVLHHVDGRGQGYFMLMIQPADDARLRETPPREISFLIDVSGSMNGQPTAKVIEAMREFLKRCKPHDTVQVITFAGSAQKLFEQPVPVNDENIKRALNFTEGLKGGGGTEMLKGIKMAINDPLDEKRVRIVVMLTDGYIGNEAEIIAEVGRRCGDRIRFWCMGIGSDPNRFLLEGVARQGGGMAKTIGLKDDPTELVQEVMFRIHRAQLAAIQIDWAGVRVFETYPAKIPELWAGRPVIVFGLYERGGQKANVTIRGNVEGQPASWPLQVDFPAAEPANDVLAKVWARNKIEDLMQQTFYAGSPEVEEAVTSLALEYRLMSQYTSFVAVDESTLGTLREPARPPRRMLVPVPLPEGTRYEGFFGEGFEAGDLVLADAQEKSKSAANGASSFGYAARAQFGPGVLALGGRPMASLAAATPMAPATSMPGGANRFRGRQELRQAGAQQWSTRRSFGLGAAAGGVVMESLSESHDGPVIGLADFDGDRTYTLNVLVAGAGEAAKRAQEVLKAAQALLKAGDAAGARAQFTLAYLIDDVAAASHRSNGTTAAAAVEGIETASETLHKAWAEDQPGLTKRLDLVIRDASVGEALEAVGKAAGVKVRLLAGSVEDAARIMGRKDLRVTYLDLRNATTAQALDWILTPVRMAWWAEKGEVVAGTVRRGPGTSAWVYDVSLVALPSAKELAEIKDQKQRLEAAKKAADEFVAGARKALAAGDDAVLWYGPGSLLVVGDAKVHGAAAKLVDDLADPKATMGEGLADLHKTTSARAEARKDAADELLDARERARVAGVLSEFSWRLVAGAAQGRLDAEALTELQIAWKSDQAGELIEGRGAALAMRSFWAVAEASQALPAEAELKRLALAIRRQCKSAAGKALAALEQEPEDAATLHAVLYGALAMKDSEDYVAQARKLLATGKDDSPLAPVRVAAAALLAPEKEIDRKALAELLTKPIRGNDLVALAALACRRAGGDVWNRFRAEARTILGSQPLDGSVVVFVNGLSRPGLALAAVQP